jgi:hypothetical protein
MSKGLLIDYTTFNVSPQLIAESERTNNGKVIVTGCLQRANAKNQNGRVYPKEILMREVKNYKKVNISERRALGELDHPESSVVNLQNVSHNVKDVWWKGDDVMGTIEVLSTPAGNILKELLKCGIKLGISSRGLGSVEELYEDGESAVQVKDDFELICWDFVSNPSTHGAFMQPSSVNESVNNINTINNKYTRINSLVSDILCEMTGKCEIPVLAKKSCCGEK